MSDQVEVARINATGALIPLHDGNRSLLLSRGGVTETMAERDPETGRLMEVDGADHTAMIAASNSLQRIGESLANNKRQREILLVAALKLPNAATYLEQLGVYKGEEDGQFIDAETLYPNNAGLPEEAVNVGDNPVIEDVTDQLAKEKATEEAEEDVREEPQAKKSAKKKPQGKSDKQSPNLADL